MRVRAKCTKTMLQYNKCATKTRQSEIKTGSQTRQLSFKNKRMETITAMADNITNNWMKDAASQLTFPPKLHLKKKKKNLHLLQWRSMSCVCARVCVCAGAFRLNEMNTSWIKNILLTDGHTHGGFHTFHTSGWHHCRRLNPELNHANTGANFHKMFANNIRWDSFSFFFFFSLLFFLFLNSVPASCNILPRD